MNKRLLTCVLSIALLLSSLSDPALAKSLPQSQEGGEAAATATQPGAETGLLGSPTGVPGAGSDWWRTVQDDIHLSEYEVTWQEQTLLADLPAAYQAPNRAQGLRSYFRPEGLRVVPRAFEGAALAWEWGLGGFGEPAELAVDGNRVEYRYDMGGELSGAWAVNDEQGVEMGFVLAGPAPEKDGGLRVEFSGSLIPRLADDGLSVLFTDANGQAILHYGPFTGADDAGEPVPLALDLGGGVLAIRTGTAVVQPPLTLRASLTSAQPGAPDGLSSETDWMAEGNQAEAYLGIQVATAGDVNGDGYSDVIVGAPSYDNGETDEGRAYVYQGSAAGLVATPAWIAEGDQVGAGLGQAVATAGDVNGDGYADVIVGAPFYDNGQMGEGRVYVYHGSAAGLAVEPAWMAESNQAGAWLGWWGAATAGDVNGDGYGDVIIGAPYYDNGQADEGRVYVYHGSAAGLGAAPAWTAEGDQAGASFGISVASAGDVNGDGYADVIVGAYNYDNGETDEGRAFVYHGSVAGLATAPAWTAEGDQVQALFGWSVATAGDVNGDGYSDVIVGAVTYSDQTDGGAAFVYHGSAGGLAADAAWTVEGGQDRAQFGVSVATAGDVNGDGYADVIVGANGYDNGQVDEGRAYVYYGAAGGLAADPEWTVEGEQESANLGWTVATAGDVNGDGYSDVSVGAPWYTNGEPQEGAAFVYHGAADGLAAEAAWTAESDQVSAILGASVASAGDVNGDGYGDVIVGAPSYDNGQADEGCVFVYHGSDTGLAVVADWMAESDQADAHFGSSVASAGDVDGDGYGDVVIGAPQYDNSQADEGAAFVYHGSEAGLAAVADWTVESDQASAWFGQSVATAGDVNGDGYADVIIGAYLYDSDQEDEGRAFVYHGSAAGLATDPDWEAESDEEGAWFGFSAATAGDVNGDGYSDVIVGAQWYDGDLPDEGIAFVYYGSVDGLEAVPAWTAGGNQPGSWFGISVAAAGDVNGDGYGDVIVGAAWYDHGQTDEGGAFVYHGSAAGLSAAPAWTAESDQDYAYFGWSVAPAGDVNSDGYADVIVGASWYDNGQVDEGCAFVYHGSAAGLVAEPSWTAESDQDNARLGQTAASAGDVNGDGYGDVVVGAYTYSNGETAEGRAFVYYGNGGDGLDVLPRQTRTDGSAPIAILGASNSSTAFQLSVIGRTPMGRDEVRVEWQVAPLGMPITATEVISGVSGWTDVLTTGVVITQSVAGLTPDTPYHWRVRLLYPLGNALGQAAGRWIHIPWAGWNETDLRTAANTENSPPVANAGSDQTIDTLATVTLDGSGSFDPDGNGPLTYGWVQAGGTPVTFTHNVSITTFTAPADPSVLTFTLMVTDSLGMPAPSPDEVVVTVTNQPPAADAGQDQVTGTLHVVTLDGSASFDPDGDDPLLYSWVQAGGLPVTFTHHVSITTFTAPVDPSVLTFTLMVTDSLGMPAPSPDEVVVTVTNQPPAADAGSDQVTDTLALVTLDGSASFDVDGDYPLSYAWTQLGGPAVAFTPYLSVTAFTAPNDPAVLTFTLIVTDSLGMPALTADEVVVKVTNQAPVADAGPDQVTHTLALVTLDGSASFDVDGDYPLTYAWTQLGGPAVAFTPYLSVTAFTAPNDPAVLTFTLRVTDSLELPSAITDEVVVTIGNQPPLADAGPDQITGTLALVTLDGSLSFDPDEDYPLIYSWRQTGGPQVTFTPDVSVTTFTAPGDPAVLTFTLAVTDSLGLPSATPDEVVIAVTNQPPVADAGPDQITDTLARVTLDGSASTDPDGDYPLAYAWAQMGGPAVVFTPNLSVTAFSAPVDPAVLTFTLRVTDGLGLPSGSDEVVVQVGNQPPAADAGADQEVDTLALVTLDGSASLDPDGDYPLAYAWVQTGGPVVTFAPNLSVTTFVASGTPAVLTFTLAVTDSLGLPAETCDEVVIAVQGYRIFLPVVLRP